MHFHVITLSDSFRFRVCPCTQVFSNSVVLNSWNIGVSFIITSIGKSGPRLYKGFSFALSWWFAYQLSFCIRYILRNWNCNPFRKKNETGNLPLNNHCIKVSVFGVFLVRVFPHSEWIRRDTPYSVRIPQNTDQKSSKHGHFQAVSALHTI